MYLHFYCLYLQYVLDGPDERNGIFNIEYLLLYLYLLYLLLMYTMLVRVYNTSSRPDLVCTTLTSQQVQTTHFTPVR